jgi:thioredoxin 1
MSQILDLTNSSFEDFISSSPLPVVVKFWAEWCGPCRILGPVIEQLSSEYDGSVRFARVNVEEEAELGKRFRIHSVPCIILFRNGEFLGQVVGALPKHELRSRIENFLGY